MPDERSLRIHEQGDAYAIRQRGHECSVPMIRLRGKWLRQAGFVAGEEVIVVVHQGRLTLLVRESRHVERVEER